MLEDEDEEIKACKTRRLGTTEPARVSPIIQDTDARVHLNWEESPGRSRSPRTLAFGGRSLFDDCLGGRKVPLIPLISDDVHTVSPNRTSVSSSFLSRGGGASHSVVSPKRQEATRSSKVPNPAQELVNILWDTRKKFVSSKLCR